MTELQALFHWMINNYPDLYNDFLESLEDDE